MKKIYTSMIALALGAVSSLPLAAQETTVSSFEELTSAIENAETETTITVSENIEITSTVNPGTKSITLKGATKDVILSRSESFKNSFLFQGTTTGALNFENITISGNNIATENRYDFEISAGTWSFTNVLFTGFNHTKGNQTVIQVKTNGTAIFNGCSFENCSYAENRGDMFCGRNDGIQLTGENKMGIYCERRIRVNDGFGAATLVDLCLNGTKLAANASVVVGSKDIKCFRIVDIPAALIQSGTKNELTWTEDNIAVVNETSNVYYANVNSVIDIALSQVKDGDVIVIKDNVVLSDRRNTKKVTLKGETGSETITQNYNNKLLFACSSDFYLENIIFTQDKGANSVAFFEAQNNRILSLTGITMKDMATSSNDGFFNVKDGANALYLKDVTFENCVAENVPGGAFVNGHNKLNLSGTIIGLHLYIKDGSAVTVSDALSDGTVITITLPTVIDDSQISTFAAEETIPVGAVIVNGCEDPSKFELTNAGYKLVGENGNLVLAKAGDTTAIDEIGVDGVDAPVEYYNVQGIRVENPEHGLYIKRQGNKVSKVIL